MPPNRKIALATEIQNYLDELRLANDPDLWEEVANKLADVLKVYRAHLRQARRTASFRDGLQDGAGQGFR